MTSKKKRTPPPRAPWKDVDDRPAALQLLANIKAKLPELEEQLADAKDRIYRFYHQSYKVYEAQNHTLKIVASLQEIMPDRPLNEWFMTIIKEGTGKTFTMEDNKRWLEVTRPIIEAFFHARYFLEMVVHYGKELEQPPALMPSGWAAVLHLYRLR